MNNRWLQNFEVHECIYQPSKSLTKTIKARKSSYQIQKELGRDCEKYEELCLKVMVLFKTFYVCELLAVTLDLLLLKGLLLQEKKNKQKLLLKTQYTSVVSEY